MVKNTPSKSKQLKPAVTEKKKKDKKKTRHCQRRDAEDNADRTLSERCSDLHPNVYDIVEVDGKTMRSHLTEHYLNNSRCSPGELLKIRNKYTTAAKQQQDRKPPSKKVKNPAFTEALAYSMIPHNSGRDCTRLYSYLSLAKELAEEEFAASIASVTPLNVEATDAHRIHATQLLKIYASKGYIKTFETVFNDSKEFFTRVVLLNVGEHMQKSKVDDAGAAWWLDHQYFLNNWLEDDGEISWLFQDEAYKKSENFERLKTKCGSSQLASLFFGKELAAQCSNRFKASVDQVMSDLALNEFNADTLKAAQELLFEKATEFHDKLIDKSKLKYTATIKYRTLEIKWEFTDPFLHVDLVHTAYVRTKVVGSKDGPPELNPVEVVCFPRPPHAAEPAKLPKSFWQDTNAARKEFNACAKAGEKTGALDILAMMDTKENAFRREDRFWVLEEMVVKHLANGPALAVLHTDVLKEMPNSSEHKTFTQVVAALDRLQETPLWKFVPTSQTGPVKAAITLCKQAQKGQLTKMQFDGAAGFAKELCARLEYFCIHKTRAQGTLNVTSVHGKSALTQKLAVLDRQKSDKEGRVDPDIVAEVCQFKFLLTPEEEKNVDSMGVYVISAMNGPVMEPVLKKQKASASKEQTKTPLELALEAANNLFA